MGSRPAVLPSSLMPRRPIRPDPCAGHRTVRHPLYDFCWTVQRPEGAACFDCRARHPRSASPSSSRTTPPGPAGQGGRSTPPSARSAPRQPGLARRCGRSRSQPAARLHGLFGCFVLPRGDLVQTNPALETLRQQPAARFHLSEGSVLVGGDLSPRGPNPAFEMLRRRADCLPQLRRRRHHQDGP